MAVRVQVLLQPGERERFREEARRRGMSLSAWLRDAGQRLARQRRQRWTPADFRAFFREIDRRNKGKGREEDWEVTKKKIAASKVKGLPDV
jgi:hypothetical protein